MTRHDKCPRCEHRHLTIDDVQNAFATHMQAFEKIWPESEKYGPTRVHIVELIEGFRLRLHQTAEANQTRRLNAFEQAAVRMTGGDLGKLTPERPEPPRPEPAPGTSQAAHAALRSRIKGNGG